MIAITGKALGALRDACRQIGENQVTVATDAGVISFDFAFPGEVRAQALGYESQPSRQQLIAILGMPFVKRGLPRAKTSAK